VANLHNSRRRGNYKVRSYILNRKKKGLDLALIVMLNSDRFLFMVIDDEK